MVLALQALILTPATAQYADNPEATQGVLKGRPYSPYADRAFPSDVYFGDAHVHTGLSTDAGGGGTRLMPRDAYRFARGEQVMSNTGQPVKLSRPYDFFAVTDQTDGMGLIVDILKGAPSVMFWRGGLLMSLPAAPTPARTGYLAHFSCPGGSKGNFSAL